RLQTPLLPESFASMADPPSRTRQCATRRLSRRLRNVREVSNQSGSRNPNAPEATFSENSNPANGRDSLGERERSRYSVDYGRSTTQPRVRLTNMRPHFPLLVVVVVATHVAAPSADAQRTPELQPVLDRLDSAISARSATGQFSGVALVARL